MHEDTKRRAMSILMMPLLLLCFIGVYFLNDKELSVEQPSEVSTTLKQKIKIKIGEQAFIATTINDSASIAFKTLLDKGALTLIMEEYGGFEKVSDLPIELSSNDDMITTALGDIILYQGKQIAIYYGPNTYALTRLAKIEDTTGLRQALGEGDVTITLSLIGGK